MLTTADIESLCGRPAAFDRVCTQLLDTRLRHGSAQSLELGRRGRVVLVRHASEVWWLWPWAPDPAPELAQEAIRWLSSPELTPRPTLRVALARMPEEPEAWTARLAADLRERTERAELTVDIFGPTELGDSSRKTDDSRILDFVRTRRALAARTYDYSDCERALMTALDHAEPASEHWLVVADELQRRGDPTGESLALALAGAPNRPTLQRELSRKYQEHESGRLVSTERHTQMLAFVNNRGMTFEVLDFLPGEQERPPLPYGHQVQIWAERVGPFFVRMLVRTDDPELRGIGLPEAVLSAAELRYLSELRWSSIHPECADISGRDLSGFELTGFARVEAPVYAYAANLRDASLRSADLTNWQLDGADLRGAVGDLHTQLGGASFDGARVSPELSRVLANWNSRRSRPGRPVNIRGLVVV